MTRELTILEALAIIISALLLVVLCGLGGTQASEDAGKYRALNGDVP